MHPHQQFPKTAYLGRELTELGEVKMFSNYLNCDYMNSSNTFI